MSDDIEKNTLMLGGKGVESFITRFKLKRRHIAVSLSAGLFCVFLIMLGWYLITSPLTHSIIANSYASETAKEWKILCRRSDYIDNKNFQCGDTERLIEYSETIVTLNNKTILTKAQYDKFVDDVLVKHSYPFYKLDPRNFFGLVLLLSCFVGALVTYKAFHYFVGVGDDDTKNKRIDGVHNLVEGDELSKRVKESGDCGWTLADVLLPSKSLVMGVAVSGMQGTGKSLAIHDLIVQAKSKNVRLFVNDPTGEFWQAHAKPENGDVFFNPALLGSVGWSIFKELVYDYDADTLAWAFLPKRESKGNGDFFDDAARSLFSAVLTRLAERGVVNTADIANAFFKLTDEELAELVEGSPAASTISSDAKGMRAGVLASAAVHLQGIAMMQPGTWSIREFLQQETGNIYFVGDEAKFKALKRLMFVTTFEIIKDLNIKHRDIKYLFVLDEYPLLGDIDVDRHLAEKRKFGVGVVLGMQAETQLVTMMTEARAETTMSVVGTTLQLRIPDAKAQKKAGEKFGSQNVRMIGENQTLAIAESKDSLGINKQQQEKVLILGSKFGMLPPLTGYLQVMGEHPAAHVDFRKWLTPGSGRFDSSKSRADEISTPVLQYPERNPVFLLQREEQEQEQQASSADLTDLLLENTEHQAKQKAKLKDDDLTLTADDLDIADDIARRDDSEPLI